MADSMSIKLLFAVYISDFCLEAQEKDTFRM